MKHATGAALSRPPGATPVLSEPEKSRSLLSACLAHALHDGYTDALYAFLPVWQAQFGLSYAALAIVRALYFGTMGGLQIPADRALQGLSPRAALMLSTGAAAAGFLIMSLPFGFAGLCVGLVVAGVGSSIQHPRASMLVAESYGRASRRPLGIYNFSGELGKAALPALVAVLGGGASTSLDLGAYRLDTNAGAVFFLGMVSLLLVVLAALLFRTGARRASARRRDRKKVRRLSSQLDEYHREEPAPARTDESPTT